MTYLEQVKEDVRDYIDEYDPRSDFDSDDKYREYLIDAMWTDDNITGNGSGSYTYDREKAREYVMEDPEGVYEALEEFGDDGSVIAKKIFLDQDWGYFDVTARCYYLAQAIDEVLIEIGYDI